MKRIAGAVLLALLGASPVLAEDWRVLSFGPPNLRSELDTDSIASYGTDYDGTVTTAWFRITRHDSVSGERYPIRMERHELRCDRAETRLAQWADIYPTGVVAATGSAPTTTPFKPVDLGGRAGHAAALWRAAC